ncbi:RING/U-box superfamily protein [Dorcoceras hygrometricum]|uniref:RING-type E3 ubiquitin transferase n=1 Tax=Dorcoceras hygrometricum TaxID=472368 RepID=A0A2Z7B1W2_9LAMI|nr:RING/U-box superfamily protein [Dorcoceras hygrometricum]
MRRSSSNLRPLENRQPGQDYREYFSNNRNLNRTRPQLLDNFPIRRSMDSRWNTRDPWWYGEIFTGGSNYGIGSLPSTAQYLLIEAYEPHPRTRNTSPGMYYNPYDQTSAGGESRLSQEDQNTAINKLRKQLYNPHISNIVRRLGTKSTSSDTKNILEDDIGKRCAICLEDFESKQFVTSTPCDHMFHEECIVPWAKSQGKCPVCRFLLY